MSIEFPITLKHVSAMRIEIDGIGDDITLANELESHAEDHKQKRLSASPMTLFVDRVRIRSD